MGMDISREYPQNWRELEPCPSVRGGGLTHYKHIPHPCGLPCRIWSVMVIQNRCINGDPLEKLVNICGMDPHMEQYHKSTAIFVLLYTNCWSKWQMWIYHMMKIDQWRSAPSPHIRPLRILLCIQSMQSTILFYQFCPSVSPYAGTVELNEWTYRQLFHKLVRVSLKFCEPHCRYKFPMGTLSGMLNTRGKEICTFLPISPLIWEMLQNKPMVTMDHQ